MLLVHDDSLCSAALLYPCSVMLTVLDNNTSAVHFYREKMRYITDMTSPSMDGTTDAGYEILSKCVNAAAYADITKRFT